LGVLAPAGGGDELASRYPGGDTCLSLGPGGPAGGGIAQPLLAHHSVVELTQDVL
jgi:hypothetical protein